MTLIIELSPDKEAAFKAQAQAMGLSIGQWLLLQLAEQAGPGLAAPQEPGREVRPVWEVITENMKHVPSEDLAVLPREGQARLTIMSMACPREWNEVRLCRHLLLDRAHQYGRCRP
ncbi:MAG: hypothetical protein ACRD9L_22030 [Bryobacteraceae bacterium]